MRNNLFYRIAFYTCCVASSGMFASSTFAQGIESAPLPAISADRTGIQKSQTNNISDSRSNLDMPIETAEKSESASVPLATVKTEAASIADIRALDKLTGTLEKLEIEVGETIAYERLSVKLNSCQMFPQRQAASMFVEIRDAKKDVPVFTGWMFSASPALSAMDHPRYDIWLVNCNTKSAGAEAESNVKSAE